MSYDDRYRPRGGEGRRDGSERRRQAGFGPAPHEIRLARGRGRERYRRGFDIGPSPGGSDIELRTFRTRSGDRPASGGYDRGW